MPRLTHKMTSTMNPAHSTSLETRASLLHRLKDSEDTDSWQEFYRTYSGLIRFFAEKAGLTPDEAEEVVQETAIGIARGLPDYVYNPKVCRFKTWLLNLTRWRIQDQLRRRGRQIESQPLDSGLLRTIAATRRPRPIECLTPSVPEFGAEWDAEWKKN